MFSCSFPVDWCATSLVQGVVRVAMAVCCAAQHATPHSTAQHPCALQQSASQVYHIPSIVLAALGGQLRIDHFGIILVIAAISVRIN